MTLHELRKEFTLGKLKRWPGGLYHGDLKTDLIASINLRPDTGVNFSLHLQDDGNLKVIEIQLSDVEELKPLIDIAKREKITTICHPVKSIKIRPWG